jgi:hypothetical protein
VKFCTCEQPTPTPTPTTTVTTTTIAAYHDLTNLADAELLSAHVTIVVLDEDVLAKCQYETVKDRERHAWKYVNHSGRVFSKKPSGVAPEPSHTLDSRKNSWACRYDRATAR